MTLLVRALDLAGLGAAALAGAAAAVLVFGLHVWHQRRRFGQTVPGLAGADAGGATAGQPRR